MSSDAAEEVLTREQYEAGLNTFIEWFPEHKADFEKHRHEILKHLVENTDPLPSSPLAKLELPPSAEDTAMAGAEEALTLTITPCQEACVSVAVDVVSFVMGLLGLRTSYNNLFKKAIISKVGPAGIQVIINEVRTFAKAEGAMAKAKALFPILKRLYDLGVFKACFKALKDHMSTWDWIKFGIKAVAQIAIWVASDGVAFIAKAVLSIMSAVQLIQDAIAAVKACKGD